jgi:hypothetical protein
MVDVPPSALDSASTEDISMNMLKKVIPAMCLVIPVCAAAADVSNNGLPTSGYLHAPTDGLGRAGYQGDARADPGNKNLTPVPITYQDFSGATLNLYAWEGRYTAILTSRSDLSRTVMAAILKTADRIYTFYQTSTGFTPTLAKEVNGKLTIAEVPATCGAGCAYLGSTGIELQTIYFDKLYNDLAANRTYDHVIFYEFGRNFWNLSPQLAYQSPDSPDAIITGFAVFMQFQAMDATRVPISTFNGLSFTAFRELVVNMVDLYLADPTQTWDNTLRLNRPQANNPSNLNATDLFASFLLRLERDYGGDAFIRRLWAAAAQRPAANSTQDAVDNFFLAACAAANRNLSSLFTVSWRWPISATAQAEAARYPM